MFNQFLRLGNVTTLNQWLRESGIPSKQWNQYDRGALYRMLHNSLYISLIHHKKDAYALLAFCERRLDLVPILKVPLLPCLMCFAATPDRCPVDPAAG